MVQADVNFLKLWRVTWYLYNLTAYTVIGYRAKFILFLIALIAQRHKGTEPNGMSWQTYEQCGKISLGGGQDVYNANAKLYIAMSMFCHVLAIMLIGFIYVIV